MKCIPAIALLGALITAPSAEAAVVLTTNPVGHSGPLIDLGAFGDLGEFGFHTSTAGPIALPGGITYTSEISDSVIGDGIYGLGANGIIFTTRIIGTNSPTAFVTLTFATEVSSFGGLWNYYPGLGDPVIAAFDIFDNMLGSFDLAVLAPISTPSATDAFEFRGIESDFADIASIRFGGSYLILAETGAVPVAPVPLPACGLLLIGAVGGLAALRRRKSS